MDEEANSRDKLSSVPLKPRTSFSVSQTSEPFFPNEKLWKQGLISLLFHNFGWYFPRYLASLDNSIEKRPPPYQKVAAGDVILDPLLNQPLVDPPTVGAILLHGGSIYLPLILIAATAYFSNPTGKAFWYDLHAGCCGLLTAIGLSEGATVLLKTYVKRRRPNFYSLCGFSNLKLLCTNPETMVREANFSFPSGHSSLANCGMTFLVWFFLSKAISRARGNRRLKGLVACVFPWSWSCFVGASRLVDNWHHPSDVIAGLIVGGMSATIVYHAWYPPVWMPDARSPWSLILEGSKSTACDA